MNKQQYLSVLQKELKGLDASAIAEIMMDFEEHFANGIARGKTEEEITADLGSPLEIARQYLDGTDRTIPAREGTGAQHYVRADQPASSIPAATVDREQRQAPAIAGQTSKPANAGKINDTALILVILFNLLLGIPIWIGLFSALFGCWVAAGGVGVAAISLFVVAIIQTGISSAILVLFGISLTALTILFGILMFFLSKWLVIGLIHYVRWNKKLVLGGQPA